MLKKLSNLLRNALLRNSLLLVLFSISYNIKSINIAIALEMPSYIDWRDEQYYLMRKLQDVGIYAKPEPNFNIIMAYVDHLDPNLLRTNGSLDYALRWVALKQKHAITGITIMAGGLIVEPNKLALSVAHNSSLTYLSHNIDRALNNVGFNITNNRGFIPHITLVTVPYSYMLYNRSYIHSVMSTVLPPVWSTNFSISSFVVYEVLGDGEYRLIKRYYFN